MYKFYFNENNEKVYFHEELGMRFEWMRPEDLSPKLIKTSKTPKEHFDEIIEKGYNILGFAITSSDEWKSSFTRTVVEKDGIIYTKRNINDIKTKGMKYIIGKYDNENYRYYLYKTSKSLMTGECELLLEQPIIKDKRTKLTYKCLKCGHVDEMEISNIQSGQGCSICRFEKTRLAHAFTTAEFVERAKEIHGNVYNYSKVIYINSSTHVEIICKKHNNSFYIIPNFHIAKNKNQGCPICSSEHTESRASREITRFLIENGIKFNKEQTFSDCKNKMLLRFDFYLVDYDICIEYDGKQHFEKSPHWGGEDKLKNIKDNDTIKTQYCEKNFIKLIRVTYYEDHLTVLKKHLSEEGIL
ncbi:hypothetical protein A4_535 [Escherichia phage A4]|nr:hypothetical protein A4_535 [Escherichia phage A4]